MDVYRTHHIDSLLRHNPGIRESRSGSEFNITGQTHHSTHFTVTVTLPHDFPQASPSITVQPGMQHRQLDSQMNASLHSLWSMHSDLGKVVRALVDDLRTATPLPATSWGESGRSYGAPAPAQTQHNWGQQPQHIPGQQSWGGPGGIGSGSGGGGGGAGPAVAGSAHARVGLPDIPSHFIELDSLSFEQLEGLDDAAKFKEFFEQLPQVRELKQAEATIQQENQALAEANLAKQPELERAKQQLLEQHALLAERKKRYEELSQRQDELTKDLSIESITAQLDIAEQEAKEQANIIEAKFKAGELTVDVFMKQFKEAAERHHMRKNKAESFKQTPH